MGITSTGIGSGLDIESIVTKLMTVEAKPLTALQTKETSYQSKLSAYGTLKSALATYQSTVSALSSASYFQGTKATLADTTIATATATSSAKTGSYSLEVGQLAQAQTLVASGVASQTTAIGTGTITLEVGTLDGSTYTSSRAVTLTIDSSNNTLSGIMEAINDADLGVTASIINAGGTTPYKLVLTSNETGTSNVMNISATDNSGTALADLLTYDPVTTGSNKLSQTSAALDAEFSVNGIDIVRNSNTATDVISGVTLKLSTVTTSATKLTISRDTSTATSAVTSFVSAYNTLASTLKSATAYDADTETAAALNGEASVRTIQSQIRSILNTPITGGATSYTMLSQVGVTLQKDGTMAVDSTKLQSALNTHFDDFAGLFSAAGKTSDSQITYTSSSSATKAGTYAVNITRLATQGKLVGSDPTSDPVDLNITSSNNTLIVKLDGNTATITLTPKTYASLDELAAEIQSKINGASTFSSADSSVKVTASSGTLTFTSDRYGSASNISITGGTAMANLNLSTGATATEGLDVAGTINGITATGSGQVLTAASGSGAEGIKLTVTGGSTGARGTVSYSQGFASKLDTLMDSILSDTGAIETRIEGLTEAIESVQDDAETLSDRLDVIEARYRAQFTALDVLMSELNSTSDYLTQQLEALANLNKQSSS